MNEQEETFQAQLEQLEGGHAADQIAANLPQEEADLITFAAALGQLSPPELDSETIASQRAALIRFAAGSRTAPQPEAKRPFYTPLLNWLRTLSLAEQAALVVVGLFALLLLITLPGSRGEQPQVADQPAAPESVTDEVTDSSADAPEVTQSTDDAVADEPEVVVVPPAAPAHQVFIPALTNPLLIDAKTAALNQIHGLVEVQQPDGSWTAIAHEATLQAGQRIRTGKLSSATLTFFDGSQARLAAKSELSIDRLNAQKPENGFRTIVMTQWRGDSDHDVQFRNDSSSRYEVNTPTGSGVARGTQFHVQVTTSLITRITVTEGRVDVTHINVTVLVFAGKTTSVLPDKAPAPPQFIVTGEGVVSQIGPEWIIGGQLFQSDENTLIEGDPQVGDRVRVEGHLLPDGGRMADRIVLIEPEPNGRFFFTGLVESMDADSWTIAGFPVTVTADTQIDADIAVGDEVQVDGYIAQDGSLVAEQITAVQPDTAYPFHFTGVVQAIADDVWTISGQQVTVTADTAVDADIAVGDLVQVSGTIQADGTWVAAQIKQAGGENGRFNLSGIVNSIDPWQVAGVSFTTAPWTHIEAGIAVGDAVHVRGVILPDGTWVAAFITRLEHDEPPAAKQLTFIGVVTSLDPLTVDNFPLVITDETEIAGDLEVGMLVRVTVALLPDGSWQTLLIEPLDEPTSESCFTLTSVVISISDHLLQLEDWPDLPLHDELPLDHIQANTVVSVTVCVNPDGTIIVVAIIIVVQPAPPPPSEPPPSDSDRVTICHKDKNTLTISRSALNAHLGHGDTVGTCGSDSDHHDDDHDDDDDDDD